MASDPASSGSAATPGAQLAGQLAVVGPNMRGELAGAHQAREVSLRACRDTIRQCSLAIRAVHRLLPDQEREHAAAAEASLRIAQHALDPFPRLAASGFLHDAEKEYAEARLTAALVAGSPLPDHNALGVAVPAWLNGLAEAASELRRHLLDRLRDGDLARGSALLDAMGDCYDVLVTVDFPDAITGGLRRSTDALRAVLERSRSDVTTTTLQIQLQRAIESMSQVPFGQAPVAVEPGRSGMPDYGLGHSPQPAEIGRDDEGAVLWKIRTVVASNVTILRGSVAQGLERSSSAEDVVEAVAVGGVVPEDLVPAAILPVVEPVRDEPVVEGTTQAIREPIEVPGKDETPVAEPSRAADEADASYAADRRLRKLWRVMVLVVLTIIGVAMAAAAVATLAYHLSIRPVLSPSMEPTYGPGWAIITRPVPTSTLKVGDIIVFTPPGQNIEYAHRIVSLSGSAAHPVVMTKGDNNPTRDAWHARLTSDTTPEVIAEVPFVGRVLNALGGGVTRAALIAAAGLIICVVGMIWIIRSGRRPRQSGLSDTEDGPAQ